MRIAVVGTRNVGNIDLDWFAQYIPPETTLIVSGGAKGIDAYAEMYANLYEIPFRKILPDYKSYRRNAPLMRNREIVDSVDQVLAFWDFASRGTAAIIAYSIEKNKMIKVIRLPG